MLAGRCHLGAITSRDLSATPTVAPSTQVRKVRHIERSLLVPARVAAKIRTLSPSPLSLGWNAPYLLSFGVPRDACSFGAINDFADTRRSFVLARGEGQQPVAVRAKRGIRAGTHRYYA